MATAGGTPAPAGDALTIVTWSAIVPNVTREGIEADVFDLRTIWPWDQDAVAASLARTGRLLVAHEAAEVGGFGAEVITTMIERLGPAAIKVARRLGAPRIPVPFAPPLENEVRISPAKIVAAAKATLA